MTPTDRFRELLRIPTVSYADATRIDPDAFASFRAALERLYPRTHARLEREIVGDGALLYRWPGSASEEPLVLMAHQDVVPVVPGEWGHAPFDADIVGEGEDASIHARGAIDDKGALVAILEAVEALLQEGVTPPRDVYLAFGHDEETRGTGAQALAALLRERGVRPGLVLDEGGAVVTGVLPGLSAPAAMIGVAERGIATFVLTAREAGGHASTPPRMPATARLARAVDRIRRRPFPVRLAPPVRALLATAAPHVAQPLRSVFASAGVLAPVLTRVLAALGPETNALVRTTAVATELTGATGRNVLATTARAWVNVRLVTGDSLEAAERHLRRAIGDPLVEIEVEDGSEPSPVSPWRGEAWRRLARTVTATLGDEVVPLPYVQLGASDSRWFTALTDTVYRFTPFRLSRAERDALHAADERIGVEVWLRGIGFYRELIIAR
ncbi:MULTISPECIES: M20/M25/M40 family metallo-hydrolase [Microbacterium]|uniref:M20/M25/M40 family metallo-hydrolase n=1 Tax=Microbacterium wangchenii TaxID=2541726 RepID=A0ABX5SX55_9MICO|nr:MULTISPECIES: M20/M25/M40 family metallo-hydrolase [Microbacterium]MCK6067680.1 M20/M25/M40 family metallo-hydrolase [Microbacterium sp. EYE_512]QBR89404.1 M20/M25/M40 family metallo-hydrolase [Microbacterium wangchenii]TFV81531.1 M20/M25/M40 family metallo-hydrolase [Microbacterium sp. dk485]TXK11077.1 M20/M25/M40 family metallo-hydrolase [Microbacterium wangchenii]